MIHTVRVNTYNYEFHLTCGACPEQYDVMLEGKYVAYVRLRWGALRCNYLGVSGEVIYEFEWDDDFMGCFNNYNERKFHLEKIAQAIHNRINAE